MELDTFCPPLSDVASCSQDTIPMPADSEPSATMSASELVYFHAAPLAHVVDYEERLHTIRCNHALRVVARTRRPHPCPALPRAPGERAAIPEAADET